MRLRWRGTMSTDSASQRLYVADLDAIERRAPQRCAGSNDRIGRRSRCGSMPASRRLTMHGTRLDCGASRVIVGLETLSSFEVLESIVQSGRARASGVQSRPARRSTDRDNARTGAAESRRPGGSSSGCGRQCDADARPCASGFRLGSRSGTARTHQISACRQSLCTPEAVFAVSSDVEQLRRVGCDGALVATALLDGQITKRDLDDLLTSPFALCPLP